MIPTVAQFYQKHLPDGVVRDNMYTAACPFCRKDKDGKQGNLVVFLNKASFFYGYFRCSNQCVAGGFQQWFATLAGVESDTLFDSTEEDLFFQEQAYPEKNINIEIDGFCTKRTLEKLSFFTEAGVGESVLKHLNVGYNGRYLVYPYFQSDGNAYSARCVHPEKNDDYFWYGDAAFGAGVTGMFNVAEIQRCAGGALFLCEGEENLLVIKQLGFPGAAYFDRTLLETLDVRLFSAIKTLFIVPLNSIESENAARAAAAKIGFKVRILRWERTLPRDYTLRQYAIDSGQSFAKKFGEMFLSAKPFSPFTAPRKEYNRFVANVAAAADEEYNQLVSGFSQLDEKIGGIHGISILGGGPKVGKSCFMIQIATEMAARRIPVLYYDFENGRQRVYQRTFSRMARIEVARLHSVDLTAEEKRRHREVSVRFEKLLRYFKVVNDRKVSPELMRRHIDFLRHETGNEYTVVVIDSLHKLPFKDISRMRSGIDGWLRQMESIRDELNVSFLVVSELSRGAGGSYDETPHMGVFKGSGDIEYSADNALVLLPQWNHMEEEIAERKNSLWLVGSREHSPGLVGRYVLDYPFWGFREELVSMND
ncbi:MAG: DnaB-like helicase C-terminal domain-containing protein [Desulfopila sp.]|jgi:KaiC/GvpD/RAD55 family RecA-like ATPase|nr:DnaB-like helicase C-terminal domain-containing protein [Desulfopila sp.]